MHLVRQKYKIDRTCGVNLWGRDKSPFNKRPHRPGQHGTRPRRKLSNYAQQLIAKQKFRYYYGMKECQFKRFFKNAVAKRGDTGNNMIQMLESRLDSIVYRLRWAPTIFAAKQMVNHGHILINGKRVNISSYLVAPGDKVELSEKAKRLGIVQLSIENHDRELPAYLNLSDDKLSGNLVKLPDDIVEVGYPCNMDMLRVIEMYSRSM
ncbi:MAG: 30S ribosomal protein S4 [Alphaproteobacteria bacterium]|nr:MAG: 30S ribosomal protein S4 [Alphaproteobacteria bacterium]